MVAENFFRRNYPGAAYEEDCLEGDFQLIEFKKDLTKFVEAIVAEVTSVTTWVYSSAIYNSYFNYCFPETDDSDPEYVSSRSIGRWLRNLIHHEVKECIDMQPYRKGLLSKSHSVRMDRFLNA